MACRMAGPGADHPLDRPTKGRITEAATGGGRRGGRKGRAGLGQRATHAQPAAKAEPSSGPGQVAYTITGTAPEQSAQPGRRPGRPGQGKKSVALPAAERKSGRTVAGTERRALRSPRRESEVAPRATTTEENQAQSCLP